jgi:hypothetical protein
MSPSPKSEVRSPKWQAALTSLLLVLAGVSVALGAGPPADLIADRTAVERVYYAHRLGNKPPFEEVLLASQLRRLVELDLVKETVLKKVYGIEISDALVQAEVRRINATTRAPEVLAELKAALGNDAARFARAVARPIVVERLLRNKFENDDALYAPQRREAERVRNELLAAKINGASAVRLLAQLRQAHSNEVSATTWQLGLRPTEKPGAENPDAVEIRKRFGPNAQILSSPQVGGKERKFYFEDLPAELQRVLRVQLRQPGDVSAVMEMPGGFLVYVCKEKTAETLSVATLSLPKRSYEQWLAEQTGEMK